MENQGENSVPNDMFDANMATDSVKKENNFDANDTLERKTVTQGADGVTDPTESVNINVAASSQFGVEESKGTPSRQQNPDLDLSAEDRP